MRLGFWEPIDFIVHGWLLLWYLDLLLIYLTSRNFFSFFLLLYTFHFRQFVSAIYEYLETKSLRTFVISFYILFFQSRSRFNSYHLFIRIVSMKAGLSWVLATIVVISNLHILGWGIFGSIYAHCCYAINFIHSLLWIFVSICHVNVQSLLSHIHEFREFFSSCGYYV